MMKNHTTAVVITIYPQANMYYDQSEGAAGTAHRRGTAAAAVWSAAVAAAAHCGQ